MKLRCIFLLSALCGGAFAQSATVVRWRGMAGVITAPGINNPVADIASGAGPWTVQSGNARINLTTGEGSFEVDGLVLNGGASTGTRGGVATVIGTFVCNPGGTGGAETIVDTPQANLSVAGDAELSFKVTVPQSCSSPLFLIRVPPAGRWIATGTRPAVGSSVQY